MSTIIFPGQGSQYIGMAGDFYDEFLICKNTFDLISNITKIDIKNIIFNNPSDFLNQTKYTQLSIFCASISIFNVLENEIGNKKLKISHMLGHSLGEYTALAAAKIVSIEDCCNLLKIRSELMQDAIIPNKSGMAAIIGLSCNNVEELIIKNNLDLEIANDNSPTQIVISGIKDLLISSENIFKEAGAKKFLLLNVSAAFHSKLMIKAQEKLKYTIGSIKFEQSKIKIISNYTGKICNDNNQIIENLSLQMANRVRWVESIDNLKKTNENKIIEIGPGKVLGGLIKRISGDFNIININSVSDMDKINSEL